MSMPVTTANRIVVQNATIVAPFVGLKHRTVLAGCTVLVLHSVNLWLRWQQGHGTKRKGRRGHCGSSGWRGAGDLGCGGSD